MLIVMKVRDEDYIRKNIDITIIGREEDFFFRELKTLKEWKATEFYENNEMEFSFTKKELIWRY